MRQEREHQLIVAFTTAAGAVVFVVDHDDDNFAFAAAAAPGTPIIVQYFHSFILSPSFRRRGTKFLNAGTITLFVMALIVWSMCVIFFFMGSVGQKLGCYTLEAPEDSELYEALEDAINEEIKEELNDTRFDDTTWYKSTEIILVWPCQ